MREKVEKRIIEILGYIDEEKLVGLSDAVLQLFSYAELKEFLTFLETGKYEVLHKFIEEKIEEYKEVVSKIKILQGTVRIEKSREEEQKEKNKEAKDLEHLLTF